MDQVIESTMAARLGARVRELREERGLTQVELARVLGVGSSAVCKIEKCSEGASNFNLSTLEQLAWALDVELVVDFRPRQ